MKRRNENDWTRVIFLFYRGIVWPTSGLTYASEGNISKYAITRAYLIMSTSTGFQTCLLGYPQGSVVP